MPLVEMLAHLINKTFHVDYREVKKKHAII